MPQAAQRLAAWCGAGATVVLVGFSGAGKSTLLNSLAGERLTRTAAIREADDKGRHTTTHRALLQLPNGCCVIDVPGLREVGLPPADDAVERQLIDVESLPGRCRFTDCTHESEPGCAIREAIAAQDLDVGRWESYRRLRAEAQRRNLDTAAVWERRTCERSFGKMAREVQRAKRKRTKRD